MLCNFSSCTFIKVGFMVQNMVYLGEYSVCTSKDVYILLLLLSIMFS